jgi:hypothetical protein
MIKKYFLLFMLFYGIVNSIAAQQRIDSLINTLGEKYPQEKLYLHFDKGIYSAGETVWFKAYLTADNVSFSFSNTVYAELIDEKGKVLEKKTMPVYESGAASNFDLPDTLSSTTLFVRAYTSWMLNFDSTLLYIKPLQIISTKKNSTQTVAAVTYSATFFPEGGDMIEAVNCRVAFKATNSNGEPIAIKGEIENQNQKKITDFVSTHDGMGFFLITPLANERYKVIWKDVNGVMHKTLLPIAKKQGVALSVNYNNDNLSYTLTRPDSAYDVFTSFTVIAQMQHQTVYQAKINMKVKKQITASISTENFGDGILQLTILNAAQTPVAERLVFVNHNTYSFITDLHLTEKNLAKHGQNTLQIDVSDTILTNLSVAVTDEAFNPISKNEENIYSNLLLTSDLKGYVYNPSYYFSTDNDLVKQQLDLVMMTNGWRRFKWDNLLAQNWPNLIWPIDNYLSIKGTIYGLSKTQFAGKDLTGVIKTKSNTSEFIIIPIDNNGQFKIDGMYLFDTAKLYYQINGDKNKTLTSQASFSFKNIIANATSPSINFLSSLYYNKKIDSTFLQKNITLYEQQKLLFSNKIKTLEGVKVKGYQKSALQKLDEQYTSGLFTSGNGFSFDVANDPFAIPGQTVMEYLRNKVAGLQISTNGAQESATWRGNETDVFLNESNTDFSALQSINMSDVALIKVFRPPFFGVAGGGAGGAIVVYTKKGGGDNSRVKGLDFTSIYGYTAVKQFYMPDYEKTNTNEPDYRTTLYWNPIVILDKKNRRIKIPFYNTDNCKKIRVVIEGRNKLGLLTREEKIFE